MFPFRPFPRADALLYLLFMSVLSSSFIPVTAKEVSSACFDTRAADTLPFEKRFELFCQVDSSANLLWHSQKMKTIKKASTNSFPSLTVLLLSDRNGDGAAEEFAYVQKDLRQNTEEFGFFFDIDHDGQVDYLVYNGGPMFSSDFSKMFWMNYHAIDCNNDGNVDVFIFNGVRLNDNELYDETKSAWIYDTDFDGIFETAEYLGKGFQQKIEKKEGVFIIKTALGDRPWKEDMDMSFYNKVLKDINRLK